MKRNGFTLVEVMVVVLIIGILAAIAMPFVTKTIEVSKFNDSATMSKMVATAKRMHKLDHPTSTISGQISANSETCDQTSLANALIGCKYLAAHSWSSMDYDFYACDGATGGGCCAANMMACAQRKAGVDAPYSGWIIKIDKVGACTSEGTDAPSCPRL